MTYAKQSITASGGYMPDVKQMLRDKLNAAYTIDEVVDATTGWTAEPAKHNRTDNIESFICGKVLLRIGSNDYEAKVEIGVTKSGQKQIHAIEEMERVSFKEKVEANPTTTASRNGIPPETVKSASTNSIVPNPYEKVNPRNKKVFPKPKQTPTIFKPRILHHISGWATPKNPAKGRAVPCPICGSLQRVS